MNRTAIAVRCSVDTDGVITPLLIHWEDGRELEIERVLHTCRSPDFSFEGTRYTVLIGGMEKYLYRDGTRWYVNAQMREVKD